MACVRFDEAFLRDLVGGFVNPRMLDGGLDHPLRA